MLGVSLWKLFRFQRTGTIFSPLRLRDQSGALLRTNIDRTGLADPTGLLTAERDFLRPPTGLTHFNVDRTLLPELFGASGDLMTGFHRQQPAYPLYVQTLLMNQMPYLLDPFDFQGRKKPMTAAGSSIHPQKALSLIFTNGPGRNAGELRSDPDGIQ
jgi:hypothetical protein